MDLLPGRITGLGVLEAGAGTEGFGPSPSFSLMAGERMEEGEEFRLCSAGPMAQSVATLQEVRPSYYTPSSKQFSLVTLI